MTFSILHIVLIVAFAGGLGAAAAFAGAMSFAKRRCISATLASQRQADDATARLEDASTQLAEMHTCLEKAVRDRKELAEWATDAKARMKSMKHEVAEANAKARETAEKAEQSSGTESALRAEREETKKRITSLQKTLVAIHQRTQSMQQEFEKASEFYKRELAKSLKIRQRLEKEAAQAVKDREAFHKRMRKSVEKHGSEENMLEAAQVKLGQIDLLERNNKKLRSEKKELYEDLAQLRKVCDDLKGELAELEELKIHNQQLVQAVEMLEKSRAQTEQEATQYRDEAEQLSASLKMKLSDIEESFAAMEQEQNDAIRVVRDAAASAQPGANCDSGGIDAGGIRKIAGVAG